ncbi:Myrcene synthase chloroplastic [Euphorbia peplus]|nr:Myrcene synthase chloroplastic [Euphorbia peplus]
MRLSSVIAQLVDDLGTSSDELKRSDVPTSIQCYMNEAGASEKEARQYIHNLIGDAWKQMNKERRAYSPLFSKNFIGAIILGVGRTGQCMYQNGDGYGIQDGETKHKVLSLFVEPIRV